MSLARIIRSCVRTARWSTEPTTGGHGQHQEYFGHRRSDLIRSACGAEGQRAGLQAACQFPLLLTKTGRWREPLVVAAAIDPRIAAGEENFLDKRILDCAVAIGRPMRATIIAAHSYYPDIIAATSICAQPNFFNVTAEMLDAEKTLHENALASLLAPYQITPQCVQVDMGIASTCLPEIAERRAVDIMVMGAISRSHLKQTLIGSTAERLLEYLPCDVLVVKETRFADSLPF
jgi:universal stress protein E